MTTALLLLVISASSATCECTKYPFEPNPPCFQVCLKKIYTDSSFRLESVKDLDPKVRTNIERLRRSDAPISALKDINNDADLRAIVNRYEFKKDEG